MTIVRILTDNFNGVSRESLLETLAFVFALLVALVLHEVAHGLVAYWNGDNTAKVYGRLSLNPMRHFDITGLIMMLLVGFGWAKPVPINPYNFKNKRVGAITVSLAGILTNLLLAFLFCALYVLVMPSLAVSLMNGQVNYILYFLVYLGFYTCWLNINFALFNLLPLFPLDGYRLLSCFVDERKPFMIFLRKYSLYIMIGLILLDSVAFLQPFSPINWYIGEFGGLILNGFCKFWGLFL